MVPMSKRTDWRGRTPSVGATNHENYSRVRTRKCAMPNRHPGECGSSGLIRHQLPNQIRRIDLPIVCEDVSLSQGQFRPVIQVNGEVFQSEIDVGENFLGNPQPSRRFISHECCTAPTQMDLISS